MPKNVRTPKNLQCIFTSIQDESSIPGQLMKTIRTQNSVRQNKAIERVRRSKHSKIKLYQKTEGAMVIFRRSESENIHLSWLN